MNKNVQSFRKTNLQNIKSIFEEKTGVDLNAQRSLYPSNAKGMQRPIRKKMVAIAAALAICITFSVPVLASSVPVVYQLLYAVSPATAQFFKPVQMSCEDNGIRMEVISAYIHEDTAEIYIAMQDLTGGRIDETIDLFDSYAINTPFDCFAHCENVSYDDETRTATFLISITQMGKQKIEEDKITFVVKEFLSNKQEFAGLLPEVNLSCVSLNPDTQIPTQIRGSSGNCYDEFEPGFTALSPSAEQYSLVSGVTISAMGYINGKLHIQVYYENILKTDNHGYVYLQNDAGEVIQSTVSISFWDSERQGSYEEYVFDIIPTELENYTLYGNFWTSDTLTEGSWEVTFPLKMEIL
jgi:hypothetical protein